LGALIFHSFLLSLDNDFIISNPGGRGFGAVLRLSHLKSSTSLQLLLLHLFRPYFTLFGLFFTIYIYFLAVLGFELHTC
jgi:hypothetical protein